ncbi:fibronectin type III domain-containing protein 9 [Brachyhypopomus gauderio]|uniref:fibronectin type III domain-containing protein 9 n=1 Tax=Brachyhypopomus gauderio TaxID=698409 RepID=UPI004042D851
MAINVHNITATSATVGWLSMPGCVDTFYSVMYHPDWNSLLMGHARKSFMREDRIPVSQTTTRLSDLSPQTSYVLCVTCRAANPSRDQCHLFTTLGEDARLDGEHGELAMGVWLASTILMVVIAVVLLWSCLLSIYPTRHSEGAPQPGSATLNRALEPKRERMGKGRVCLCTTEHSEEDSQQATGITNPLHARRETGQVNGQSHKLMTPTKN